MMRKLLKTIAPKAFNDGLARCNNLAKKLIAGKSAERFLDVGCGDGKLTMEFAGVVHPKEIFGIEIVGEYSGEAEKRGIRIVRSDLNKRWDFEDNFFDLILSSQNIEHLHNTRLYLEECYRCLKRQGQIIVLTENLSSWINVGALMLGWQPFSSTNINGWSIGNPFIWHINEAKDEGFLEKFQDIGMCGVVGHLRVLSFIGLKELIEKVGFKNVRVFTRGYLPMWGLASDLFCAIDKRHGHFLIASAIKP